MTSSIAAQASTDHAGMTDPSQASAPERARPRLRVGRPGRVQMMTVVLCAAAVAMVALVAAFPGRARPFTIPWFVLAPLFCASEVCVVHIQFRREAHSFSMSEVPLVVGLFFTPPLGVVLGTAVGTGLALAVWRRQSPLKLAFNLGNFTLGTAVSVAIFSAIAPASDPVGTLGCLAALAALTATGLVQTTVIIAAIFLSDGRIERSGVLSTFGFAMLGTVVNSSLALVGVALLWFHPEVAWLLVVPTIGIVLAYRSYISEHGKRNQVGFLYESSRQLQRTTEVDEALINLLNGARETFRAEMAEITIFPTRDNETVVRTSVSANGDKERMHPVTLGEDELCFVADIVKRAPIILERRTNDTEKRQYLEARRLRDGMVAVLRGETRLLGIMLIGNRLGEVSTFDEEDLRLFEMLAAHTGTALEKGRLEHSLAQLTELQHQLSHQAFHDSLTGMANRLLFRTRVSDALARTGQHVAVLFVDLDDFKTINDSLGHAVGDQLLCAVAERVSECLRPGDIAARLGGDEFALLLEGVSDGRAAIAVADRIVERLREPFLIGEEEILAHASIGIVTDVAGERSTEELLRNADEAMYMAKSLGKGRWETFAPSMHAAVRRRHELKADLHRTLERGELGVEYQPIVELSTGRIVAAEALLRWAHPRRGMIAPSEFISLAEETGLIAPIGRWVLERACSEVMAWQQPGQAVSVAVNLSARQLQRGDFADDVRGILERTGADPRLLILEVTESIAVDEEQGITECLAQLRSLGIRIALDDFGTGHSSLSRLRDFPIDILKIDKSFTTALGPPGDVTGLSQAVFRFGHSLGLTVIAEGVDDPEQLHSLHAFSCEWAQGFHFSNALPPDQMRAILARGPLDTGRGYPREYAQMRVLSSVS
ncbi:MAG: EAL domain-containing protein [Candidatus Dormibacteraeota bacterium]|nr:EAL domain-containing protein [Candidatus Dormibacteraeota bacterium]